MSLGMDASFIRSDESEAYIASDGNDALSDLRREIWKCALSYGVRLCKVPLLMFSRLSLVILSNTYASTANGICWTYILGRLQHQITCKFIIAMAGFNHVLLSFVLSILVICTTQVDITLNGFQTDGRAPDMYDYAVCPRQPPGVCCHAPEYRRNGRRVLYGAGASDVTFRNLRPGDIGAVFSVEQWPGLVGPVLRGGCSSTVLKSVLGPGEKNLRAWFVGGASYISLGQAQIPPDSETILWLTFQGVFGLA